MPTDTCPRLDRARLAGGLPHVDPVALSPLAAPFDDPDWIFEPKYDGFRGFVYASRAGCEVRSRHALTFDRFGDLCDRIARVLGKREAILDGEVVSLDRQGKPSFRDLIRDRGFLAFAAFDLVWLDGRDLRRLPLAERKRHLSQLLPEDTGPLYKILTLDEYGRALFGAIGKMDLAGIVAKRKQDPYGPEATWYGIANPGYRQGDRRLASPGKLPAHVTERRVGSGVARRG